jgi:ketosteroid isomerase-like protein
MFNTKMTNGKNEMKVLKHLCWIIALGAISTVSAQEFDSDQFAKAYFNAWSASQSPSATAEDLEHYLSFLSEDVGHQHYPYDPDDSRAPTGKADMREGMTYYLGAHTEYKGQLISHLSGHDVIVIKYESWAKGIHPQTQQEVSIHDVTVEVLEIENGKVAVIRKYND